MHFSRYATATATALLLLLPAAVWGEVQGSPVLLGHRYTLKSRVLHEKRDLFVGLPEHYEKSKKAFPVLYVLDGNEQLFLGVMAVARTLASQDRMPGTIVVAIPSTERNHDLTPPTQDPAHAPAGAGGADTFLEFLHDELIPWVDSRFRATRHRTVIGDSFGGLFAIHALYSRPDTFDAYVAISPSVWWNREAPITSLQAFLEKSPAPAKQLVVTLSNEPEQMRKPMGRLTKMLRTTAPRQFHWSFIEIPRETHDTTAFPAMWPALRAAFADWPITDKDRSAGIPGLQDAYRRRAATYGVSAQVPPRGYFELGYGLLERGKPKQALDPLERAAKLDPGYAYPRVGLSMVFEKLGRIDEAIASMRKAVELTKSRNQELAPLARRELTRLEQLQAKH